MNHLDPLTASFWHAVGTAVLCGAIVGLERQLRGKPAGVRTSILICLGTAVFLRLGVDAAVEGGDPARVLGQVVTGIGFLGAGVIMIRQEAVYGVTTAAVIWILAAIGASIGFEHYRAAITLAVITVVILAGLELLESSVRAFARGVYARRNGDNQK
jgi:putative Mg2+ transporter-C (MgtC) family protein